MSKRILSVVVSIMLAGMCLACASCGEKEASFSQEKVDRMRAAVLKVMEEKGAPGAAVGVWLPGEGEWIEALGEGNVSSGMPLLVEDRFRVASITKTFTATLALILSDEGKLSLDDPVERYVPGIPDGGEITVRRLLNHTSGLHEYTDDPVFLQAQSANPFRKWQPMELVDIAIANPPYFRPGEGFHYSNTNYILLGMIVETAAGSTYADQLRSGILEPLGLENTCLPTGTRIGGGHADGYWDYTGDGVPDEFTEMMDASATWAAGALVSDLGDLRKWSEALATGELLEPETQRQRLEFVETEAPELAWVEYGLGIMDHDGMLGHDGATPGYNSCMFYRPGDGACVIVLVNLYTSGWDNTADAIFRELEAMLFP